MRMSWSLVMALVLGTVAGAPADAATAHTRKARTHGHAAHRQKGRISYYHPKLAGKKMANGEVFRPDSNNAASKTLPLGTKAKVTNLENGRSETVEVTDHGPAAPGRLMDVSPATASRLDMKKDGTVPAEITPIPASDPVH
jgi:rare lipoprotein A